MDEYERARQLRDLLSVAGAHPVALSNARARMHLAEGFDRRVLMIERCVHLAEEHAVREGGPALAPAEASVLSLYVNAYWMHLCGALDNLAWALNYELALFPDAHEEEQGARRKVTLFHKHFIGALETAAPSLAAALPRHALRYEELRRWRDPGAHRIPLCAAPGVVDGEGAETLRHRHAEADAQLRTGDIDGGMEILLRAHSSVTYRSVVVVSAVDGLQAWPLVDTIERDQQTFVDIAGLVLSFFRGTLASESAV